ncbi:MAG: M48 family metallopeptidase [Candidatus Paceibacterota bacterium]
MFTYTVKKSQKAKHLRITVRKDGSVTVTVPRRGTLSHAEKFVQEKKVWIEDKIIQLQKRSEKAGGLEIPKGSRKDLLEKKDEALALVTSRLQHFNAHYGFTWKNISVKNMTTRWGSCSKIGNLNFSYKIVYLSPKLADYLVVHELCHLGEFNHSKKFWDLVATAIPDYLTLRKQLKYIE